MNAANPSVNVPPVHVLIVDDHPSTATTLARAISQLGTGIEVTSAESGEKALQLVQDRSVDLLITDMVMPGMNGLELIEKLQARPGGRPAYTALITAYDVPGLKESARRLKVNDVIIKPIRPERICQIVTRVVDNMGRTPIPQALEVKQQPKILVADDLLDNVTLLRRYLQNEGYLCMTASNGVETLAKMRAEMPDLVLLDVNMPVKDGFETLQEIRSEPTLAHIPVIILTARLEPVDMQFALNMGADDYVMKPFDRRELMARIRTKLRVKESEDAMRRRNRELSLLPEIGKELSARLNVDELTSVMLRRTVETLGALLGHAILLTPGEPLSKTYHFSAQKSPAPDAPLPPLGEMLAQVKETRQGLIIEDAHRDSRWQVAEDDPTRAVVAVPLFGRFQLLGLLVLAHEQAGYFHTEHKLLLQAIASQAAIALENAQLHASLERTRPIAAPLPQGRLHAALIIDAENRLRWVSPGREKLFANPCVELGEELKTEGGYDPLIHALDRASTAGGFVAGEVAWPDGRTFVASLAPMEDGSRLVLLTDPKGERTAEKNQPKTEPSRQTNANKDSSS